MIVFFQPGHDVYEDVHNLLKEYEYASPLIRVEWVDPDRDLARTEELMRKYQVDQANVVVFDAGGRSKYVTARDIAEYDYSPVQFGQMPERIAFKGEQAFSSAIQSITESRRPVVYFLQGHGERDVDSFNRSAGYSSLAQEIKRDNVDVRKLTLGETQGIPGGLRRAGDRRARETDFRAGAEPHPELPRAEGPAPGDARRHDADGAGAADGGLGDPAGRRRCGGRDAHPERAGAVHHQVRAASDHEQVEERNRPSCICRARSSRPSARRKPAARRTSRG